MTWNNSVENKLIHRIDRQRMRQRSADIDSISKPFKLCFQPPRDNHNIFERDATLRKFYCMHGKPYMFKGTKFGCNRCA